MAFDKLFGGTLMRRLGWKQVLEFLNFIHDKEFKRIKDSHY